MRTNDQAIAFYRQHPISLEIVLKRLRTARGDLVGVKPEELWPHDQDHYGGTGANDVLAERASVGKGARVADFCAGLGGPARYMAHVHGAHVTGVELTPARVAGARELTRLVGLEDRVEVLEGDVTAAPIADGTMDAVVSQEALLHVGDKAQAIAEAFRVLKKGGRFAFTDWTCNAPLSPEDAQLLWDGQAVQTLQSRDGYRARLEGAGFRIVGVQDLTAEWGPILRDRLRMYEAMRAEAAAAGTPPGTDAFHRSYVRFVALVGEGRLGGLRATAEKP